MKKLIITLSFTIISWSVFSQMQATSIVIIDEREPVYDTLRGTNNLMHGRFDVTHLTVLDTIDARTFRFIRDYLYPRHVDLSRATIVSYKGADGTTCNVSEDGTLVSCIYKENELPASSFRGINLKKIILPESLTSIGNGAFENSRIDSIVIPAGVKYIGSSAFQDCDELEYVSLPDSLQYIDSLAFEYSTLSVIKIPENAKIKVAYRAFSECSLLREVVNSHNIDSIGEEAFSDCEILRSFVLSDKTSVLNDGAFSGCDSLRYLSIPDNVKNITLYDFTSLYGWSNNITLNIPENTVNIKFVDDYPELSFVVARDNPAFSSIDGVLYNKKQTTLLYFPKNISGTFTVPASVREIAPSAFAYSEIDTVICNKKLLKIGDHAFYKCESLNSINLPKNLKEISPYAFCHCESLDSINLPKNLKKISLYAFSHCKSLNSINLPKNLKEIGASAFYGCESLKSINLPDNLEEIGHHAFDDCSKIREMTIPRKMTTIKNYTFSGNKDIAKLIIPESVKIIEPNALPRYQNRQHTLSVYWQNPESVSYYMDVCDSRCNDHSPANILKWQTLEVPFGTKEKYLATPSWNYYPVIIEREKE